MPDQDWLAQHVRILRNSYRHWTGQDLLPVGLDDAQAVTAMDTAGFAVVSHDTRPDPVFNYGNRAALQLFEMTWEEFTALPSRYSAEPVAREERDYLLHRVTQRGYIDDYSGIRISSSGIRFHVSNATVWNLLDDEGASCGQAALLRNWRRIEPYPHA